MQLQSYYSSREAVSKNALSTYMPEDAQQQKFNFFQQKPPPSVGSEMNAGLSYFATGIQTSAERN